MICYIVFTISFRIINDVEDDFTKQYILIHHNFLECFLVSFLILPHVPRNLPENFNELIFDNLENLVKILIIKIGKYKYL